MRVILDANYPAERLTDCLRPFRAKGWIQMEAAGAPPPALEEIVTASSACRLALPQTAAAGSNLWRDFSTLSARNNSCSRRLGLYCLYSQLHRQAKKDFRNPQTPLPFLAPAHPDIRSQRVRPVQHAVGTFPRPLTAGNLYAAVGRRHLTHPRSRKDSSSRRAA